jgi:hypothetical protein
VPSSWPVRLVAAELAQMPLLDLLADDLQAAVAEGAFPDELDTKPTRSTRTRTAVSTYWEIDEIRPAFNHAKMVGAIPNAPFPMPNHTQEKGRMKMPAFSPRTRRTGVCLHVGRRPVILSLRRDGSVPVAGVVVDHVLFVERLLPVQDV